MPTLFSDAKRVSDVSRVLVSSGLGYVALQAGLKQHLPFWNRLVPPAEPPLETLPQRTRKVFEELGGAYLKLGQLLSIRPDLVPPEFIEQFKLLQDQVPPFPTAVAHAVIGQELGKPVEELFSSFDETPLGSASVAQVHRARLKDGTRVVVKVQRPSVAELFRQDIDIMRRIAEQLRKHEILREYDPMAIVEEFERSTRRELDFRTEAQAVRRFESMFGRSRHIAIPHIYQATKSVVVMSELQGTKLSELGGRQIDRHRIVTILVDCMIEQIFEHSFFHADLHPGNILLMPGNRIGLLDFGITGTLTPQVRNQGIAMYSALASNDSVAAVRALQSASLSSDIDREGLQRDINELFMEWQDEQHRLPTHTFYRMFRRAATRGVKLPTELILVGKALVTLEGTCQTLDPSFNLIDYGFKHFKDVRDKKLRAALSPAKLGKKLRNAAESLSQFSEDTLAIMERLKRGVVTVDVQDTDIRHIGRDLNTSSNRLSFALVISALLVFSALVINVSPKLGNISIYTHIGLIAAVVTLLALLISIWREGKKGVDRHD
jgi:ubiquinone biosynthesis protein